MENSSRTQEIICPHCGFSEEMPANAIPPGGYAATCLKCGQFLRFSTEPALKRIDTASSFGEHAAPHEMNAVFAVKFQTFAAQDNRFAGTGTLRLTGDMIEVSGRRRRPFAFGRVTEFHPQSSVRNVTRSGRVVSFILPQTKGHWEAVMVCSDDVAAAKLEALLPTQKDPAYSSAQAAKKELDDRLAQLPGGTPAVWTLLALNCLIYLAVALTAKSWFAVDSGMLAAFGGNFSPLTTEGQWWRMQSATFLHAGIIHLAFNMYALHVFGILVERLFGTRAFVGIYLLSGLAGSAGTLLASPASVGVGASGAIFGIMGALVAFLSTDRRFLSEGARRQLLTKFVIYATYTLVQGFGKSGIDNAAHVGGFLAGLLLGWMSGTPLRLREEKNSWLTGRVAAGICLVLLGAGVAIAAAPRMGPDFRIYVRMLELTNELGTKEKALGEVAKRVAEKGDKATREEVQQLTQRLRTTYDGFEGKVDALLPTTQGLKARKELLRSYMAIKKEAGVLLAQSIEQKSQQPVDEANRKLAEAKKLAEELAKPVVWYR